MSFDKLLVMIKELTSDEGATLLTCSWRLLPTILIESSNEDCLCQSDSEMLNLNIWDSVLKFEPFSDIDIRASSVMC